MRDLFTTTGSTGRLEPQSTNQSDPDPDRLEPESNSQDDQGQQGSGNQGDWYTDQGFITPEHPEYDETDISRSNPTSPDDAQGYRDFVRERKREDDGTLPWYDTDYNMEFDEDSQYAGQDRTGGLSDPNVQDAIERGEFYMKGSLSLNEQSSESTETSASRTTTNDEDNRGDLAGRTTGVPTTIDRLTQIGKDFLGL